MEKVVINQRISSMTFSCLICNENFTPKSRTHMTCSEVCAAEIAQNRRALETLDKVNRGTQACCRDCGKLLTLPINIKRKYCSYECAVRNRKRPKKTQKIVLTMQRVGKSCAYCGTLIRYNVNKPTKWGKVCTDECRTLIALCEGGLDGSERSVHVTRAGCDMPMKRITAYQVDLWHNIKARKNKKLRSSIPIFRLPSNIQIDVMCKRYALDKKVYCGTGRQVTVSVPTTARLSKAHVHGSDISLQFLEPIIGWASRTPVFMTRSFIYAQMDYENKDSYEWRASKNIILRRIPHTGEKAADWYLYEIMTPKQLEHALKFEDTDDAVIDLGIRYAHQVFQQKGISHKYVNEEIPKMFTRSE